MFRLYESGLSRETEPIQCMDGGVCVHKDMCIYTHAYTEGLYIYLYIYLCVCVWIQRERDSYQEIYYTEATHMLMEPEVSRPGRARGRV